MEEVLPPAGGDEFGEDDGDDVAGIFSREAVYVAHEGPRQFAIG